MSRIAIGGNGVLKVDGVSLPCLVRRVGGRGKVVMDSSKVEGSSGRRKVFDGWDDWDVSVDATIYEPQEHLASRYDHLRKVNDAFKQLKDGLPVIYGLESQLASALDIRQVLFASLDVTDESGRDAIELSINFTEHHPVVALVQRQQVEREKNEGSDGGLSSGGEVVPDIAPFEFDAESLRRAEKLYG